jgi:hypothetical protein
MIFSPPRVISVLEKSTITSAKTYTRSGLPRDARSFEIIRMENHRRKIICFQLFQIPTDVFQQHLVRIENSSLRVNDSDELRYNIDDQTQTLFARAQGFLGML